MNRKETGQRPKLKKPHHYHLEQFEAIKNMKGASTIFGQYLPLNMSTFLTLTSVNGALRVPYVTPVLHLSYRDTLCPDLLVSRGTPLLDICVYNLCKYYDLPSV